jgi:hypothetical protein
MYILSLNFKIFALCVSIMYNDAAKLKQKKYQVRACSRAQPHAETFSQLPKLAIDKEIIPQKTNPVYAR